MKKFLLVLAIVAGVVAVHYLIIKMVLPKKSKPSAESNFTENQDNKNKTGSSAKTPDKVVGMPEGQITKKPNLLARPAPYSYQNAVNGDIKEIPTSKSATTGILVDLDTRKVLWAKNPRKGVPIASMTKMMTALLVFEDIENGTEFNLDTPIKVTPTTSKIGGSQVYLDPKETFSLGELLKTVMIVSANDSAHLVAETIGGGNIHSFVAKMNKRADELMLANTRFSNPTGLPADTAANDNISSPEGLVIVAEMLLRYPKAVEWASTWQDTFRKDSPKPFTLTNHNKLVKSCPGVNGMKTGFINRSGYCVTVTCVRGNRRLAVAVTGFPSSKDRNNFVVKLLDWGYARLASTKYAGGPLDDQTIPK